MIFRSLSVLVGCLILSSSTYSQFTGFVQDASTLQPIPFAEIYLPELRAGVSTDEQGVFQLDQYPASKARMEIAAEGYQSISTEVDLGSAVEEKFRLARIKHNTEERKISLRHKHFSQENIVQVAGDNMPALQRNSPTTLAEAISLIPGVDQITTGTVIGKPVVRGLAANRVITYAQGIRIENQQWGAEHGLGIGATGIEAVELIKGPASLQYGTDALGGVLHFIDERYAQQNTVEGFLSSRLMSNQATSQNDVGIKVNKDHVRFNLFGSTSSNADYLVPSGSRVENTRFKQQNVKASLGFDRKNWISNIRYSNLRNTFGIPQAATFTDLIVREATLPFQSVNTHNITVDNTLYAGASKFNLTVGHIADTRQEFETSDIDPELAMQLNTTSYNLRWTSPTLQDKFNLTAGLQRLQQENTNTGQGMLIPNLQLTDAGAFLLGRVSKDRMEAQAALRYDFRRIDTRRIQLSGTSIFPELVRSYGKLNYAFGWTIKGESSMLRANIASGFRPPTSAEIASNGEHSGTGMWEFGDPDLLSEFSTQFDISYQRDADQLAITVNPFVNSVDNFIYLEPTGNRINGAPELRYAQLENAMLFGGELMLNYQPSAVKWLQIESNLSTLYGQDVNANPVPAIPATRLLSTAKAAFDAKKNFKIRSVFIQHQHKFAQNRPSLFETNTASYGLVHMGTELDLFPDKQPITITAGVRNMFNVSYIDHLSRLKDLGIPNAGRNFYISLRFNFSGNLGA